MEERFHSIDDLHYKNIEPATVRKHNITKAMCKMWFLQQSYFTDQTYTRSLRQNCLIICTLLMRLQLKIILLHEHRVS